MSKNEWKNEINDEFVNENDSSYEDINDSSINSHGDINMDNFYELPETDDDDDGDYEEGMSEDDDDDDDDDYGGNSDSDNDSVMVDNEFAIDLTDILLHEMLPFNRNVKLCRANDIAMLRQYRYLSDKNIIELELVEKQCKCETKAEKKANKCCNKKPPNSYKQIINHKNKNTFLLNENYTPLLYAVDINQCDLVYDLITHFNCDTNITVVCSCKLKSMLTNKQAHGSKHDENFPNIGLKYLTNKQEIESELEAIKNTRNDATEVHFYSTLMLACMNNNMRMCELLLENNVDVNYLYAVNCQAPSMSALSIAISNLNIDLVKLLARYNANLHARLWANTASHTYMFSLMRRLLTHEYEATISKEKLNGIYKKALEIYDFLSNNNVYLTNGDLYALQQVASKNEFTINGVYLLIKFLLLANMNKIESKNIYLLNIIKLFIYFIYFKHVPMFELNTNSSKKQSTSKQNSANNGENNRKKIEKCLNECKSFIKMIFIGGLYNKNEAKLKVKSTNNSMFTFYSSEQHSTTSIFKSVYVKCDDSNRSPQSTASNSSTNKDKTLTITNLASFLNAAIPRECGKLITHTSSNSNNQENKDKDSITVLTNELFKELKHYVNTLTSKPLKLKQICRQNIRSNMNEYSITNIDKLKLPNQLKEYLYFSEI